jgi:hypothetical protein
VLPGAQQAGYDFLFPFMPRKRGNPNWASGQATRPTPAVASEFELETKKLGLTKETYAASEKLRQWCERNKERCYIPEWLLKEWAIRVDPNLG